MTAATPTRQPARSSATRTLLLGAAASVAVLVLYACLFVGYAVLRSSLQILSTLSPGDGLFATVVANAMSIGLAATSVTLLMAFLVAPLGAVTLLLASWVDRLLNPSLAPRPATWIGAGVAAIVFAAFAILILQVIRPYVAAFWPQGFLFWLGLPGLLFIGAMAWANRRLTE